MQMGPEVVSPPRADTSLSLGACLTRTRSQLPPLSPSLPHQPRRDFQSAETPRTTTTKWGGGTGWSDGDGVADCYEKPKTKTGHAFMFSSR
ncbi:Hypothetical protein NTJ_01562 [Nesidiocoris tenuis]|uniref:Uncharacterized protein n=1 Tax=Nesidiocoris tenuis TaxID=355587 RepID=A0ABN7AD24_9HEMI|nr:Hypothetical protein NTJ_01562 [Nesidiocoris tenuis]